MFGIAVLVYLTCAAIAFFVMLENLYSSSSTAENIITAILLFFICCPVAVFQAVSAITAIRHRRAGPSAFILPVLNLLTAAVIIVFACGSAISFLVWNLTH